MKYNQLPDYILNTIFINGKMSGHFISVVDYWKIGSKRSLVELATGIYTAEENIQILAQGIKGIPFITEN